MLINRFRKRPEDCEATPEEKIFNFWIEYFVEATKTELGDMIRFPVSLWILLQRSHYHITHYCHHTHTLLPHPSDPQPGHLPHSHCNLTHTIATTHTSTSHSCHHTHTAPTPSDPHPGAESHVPAQLLPSQLHDGESRGGGEESAAVEPLY